MSAILIPGQLLPLPYSNERKFSAGAGCFEQYGKLFASVCGKLVIEKNDVVNVLRGQTQSIATLQPGSFVTAKVVRIREGKVDVKIIMIDETTVNYNLQGIIRKQDIRASNLDILKMEEQFIPGDIIKAKFLSFGDSQKLYLTVQEDELGVIFAKHSESKQLMIPYNWEEMICLKTGEKEKRKVAKPNIALFAPQQQQ